MILILLSSGVFAIMLECELIYELIYSYHAQWLSSAELFVTPWTAACQAPLSLGFPNQEYLEWVAISSSRGSS